MFEHPKFDNYSFEEIPLDRDIYLMDESYIHEYEDMLLKVFNDGEYKNVGYVGFFAARKINPNSVEMSWYPNFNTRFHEVVVSLPRDQFITCVGSWQYDEKPHIFVKDGWLKDLHLRTYSIFGMVDAVGVKNALECGSVSREKLVLLRNNIDQLSTEHPDISFISFADSLLLKSNWSAGYFNGEVAYKYEPEIFIHLAVKLNTIYVDVLGLKTYAVLAQGQNAFYDDPHLHISSSGNHISLNSLGIPFAQIMSIEKEARKGIRDEIHEPAELYMDELYCHSLNFVHGFEKSNIPSNTYREKMIGTMSKYYYTSRELIITNLDNSS